MRTKSDPRQRQLIYPDVDDILGIHEDIVSEDEDTKSGVPNKGLIDFSLSEMKQEIIQTEPDDMHETIHEKAVQLMRLLAENHTFVDGNKRTALNSTWTFYAMNGFYFDYGEEIKAILKMYAVLERMIDEEEAVEYFEDIVYPLEDDRTPSPMIRGLYLPSWHQSHHESVMDHAEKIVKSEDITTHSVVEFSQLMLERQGIIEQMRLFQEAHRDEFPDELSSFLQARIDDWDNRQEVYQVFCEIANGKREPDNLPNPEDLDIEIPENDPLDALADSLDESA